MLVAYYSKGYAPEKIFSEVDISRKSDLKTCLNKYDVMHIDIRWFLANYSNVIVFIVKSVQDELRTIYLDVSVALH